MIILFHIFLNLYITKLLKFKRQIMEDCNLQNSDIVENLSFDPPVYKQRYAAVYNVLLDNPWKNDIKKLVDFGCAEFQLFMFIKSFYRLTEILEVDIDSDLLKDFLHRLRPLTCDYINKRLESLVVHVYQGSISDPDDSLMRTDVVVGIELIEHLYPHDLEALPYNVFGFIKPKIAIFTTPNSDFNVLFPKFKGFRHPDHKFEWSREQFESWATNITLRYPDYTVSFQGIGEGPKGKEHLGCCSQMAVFVKNTVATNSNNESVVSSFGVCRYNYCSDKLYTGCDGKYYNLIDTIEYPYEKDDRTIEQKILDELRYGIQLRNNINGRFYNEDLNKFEIPISELIYGYKATIATEIEAREILKNANYNIEQCTIHDKIETCVVFEPEMEESRSSTPLTSPSTTEWSPYNASDDDEAWDTSSEYQRSELSQTSRNDSSEVIKEIVDGLINSLSEENIKISNGINLFIANDMQKLIPIHEHERKVRLNLKSHTLAGLTEAGPSYAKKRKKKLHEDDNESLSDIFRNAENEIKLEESTKIVEINDSDGEELQENMPEPTDLEVEVASREALFDPNSVIELAGLDDWINESNNVSVSPNFVLIGVNVDANDNQFNGPVLPLNADPFPNWLLHMLGAEVVVEDVAHDEPHFYCQGDGVGVHPSFIEGEFEEEHSSSSSDNSSNESNDSAVSNDVAQAESTVSEVEVVSLPDDGTADAVASPPAVASPVASNAAASDEFYDTVDESITVSTNSLRNPNCENATTSNKP